MAIITYRKTIFNEPAVINNETYLYFKKALTNNPNFQINTSTETFINKFKRSFKFLTWALPILVILIGYNLLFMDTSYLPLLAFRVLLGINMLFGLICSIVIFKMLLEGTSYAIYLHNKNYYFIGMQHAIKQSNNFEDFNILFYGGNKKTSQHYKVRAKEAIAINKPAITVDSFLIGLFRIFDVLGYIIGFIGIALLIKHYFFDK